MTWSRAFVVLSEVFQAALVAVVWPRRVAAREGGSAYLYRFRFRLAVFMTAMFFAFAAVSIYVTLAGL